MELYYSLSQEISADSVSTQSVEAGDSECSFAIDRHSQYIRIDLGSEASDMTINDLSFYYASNSLPIDSALFERSIIARQGIVREEIKDGSLVISTEGNDPYLLVSVAEFGLDEWLLPLESERLVRLKLLICVILDAILILMGLYALRLFAVVSDAFYNRGLIWDLAWNDFRKRYAGSFFGALWAFVQPVVTVLMYWFVFQVGLGAGSVGGYPFALWLIAGLVPWLFFQDAVLYGTSSLQEYSFLVKKVRFNIGIIPIVKIISAMIIHVAFALIAIVIFTAMKCFPGAGLVQMIYYSFCTASLATGIAYMSCAIVVFFRDFSQIISIILQVGTWATPILWQLRVIPVRWRWIFRLNPMYYVVQGYRDACLSGEWFFERLIDSSYFWIFTLGMFMAGVLVFQRLRPHFADVL